MTADQKVGARKLKQIQRCLYIFLFLSEVKQNLRQVKAELPQI